LRFVDAAGTMTVILGRLRISVGPRRVMRATGHAEEMPLAAAPITTRWFA
jgi:hypothetical protein